MANTKHYYSGQGSLMIAERDATTGKPKGFLKLGNIPELTLDIEIDKFEHKESESGNRALDLTFPKEKKGKFKFKLESLSLENLAVGLYGATTTVAGANVASEIVTAYSGKIVALAHPDVSAVVVKDEATGLITYVAGDDYILNAKHGSLEIIPVADGGTIVDLSDLDIAYTYGGYSNMEAFTQSSSPERYLRFEGLNTIDDTPVIIDLFRAQFDPLTGYGLINEELGSIDMAGSLLLDDLILSGSQFFRQRNVT
jgi:hypothetical protein